MCARAGCCALALALTVLAADALTAGCSLAALDAGARGRLCLRLLSGVLQRAPADVRRAARTWRLEDNEDRFASADVVRQFVAASQAGLLPRGAELSHTSVHMVQAALAARLLLAAVDFDAFLRTACVLRARLNAGMFVYAFTAALYRRRDCRDIYVPPPYEILPHYFVRSHVFHKAMVMKTAQLTDPDLLKTFGISVGRDTVVIDGREDGRHFLTEDDRLAYFTEDVDLSALLYLSHITSPPGLGDEEEFGAQRWGESTMYGYQQLLARLRLERLSHGLRDVSAVTWDEPLQGSWPQLQLPGGDVMPGRPNDVTAIDEHSLRLRTRVDDAEHAIRRAIRTGRLDLRDERIIEVKEPEDMEGLSRLLLGGLGGGGLGGGEQLFHLMDSYKKLLSYNSDAVDRISYSPAALDTYMSCARDPLFWRLLKRLTELVELFKQQLPPYTRDELGFPGVTVTGVHVDRLATYLDEYSFDITNVLLLDDDEVKNESNIMYLAKTRRLNQRPFKITVDVDSERAGDAVVRVFLGPKHDYMGRALSVSDTRLGMFEIDSFLYTLERGRNVVVRDSRDFHMAGDWLPTRRLLDDAGDVLSADQLAGNLGRRTLGFPRRLLLPLGRRDGLPLQLFVIVSPVRSGGPPTDLGVSDGCGWAACSDSMPLGFPFDRELRADFLTDNMKFVDVKVYREEAEAV